MNKIKRISAITTTLIFIILYATLILAQTEDLTLKEYQEENTYILDIEKNIDTTINGDLFLITTSSKIQGTINKDLNAISGNISIKGIVGDDLRLIASNAHIKAYIFNELKFIGEIVNISNMSVVKGKTTIKSTKATIKGTFNDDVKINSNTIEFDAIVHGDTVLEGQNININPATKIYGTLTVPEGVKVPNNTVNGDILYDAQKPQTISAKELLLNKITLFLMITILAGFIHFITKNKINEKINESSKTPLTFLLIGLAGTIILPIIAIISLITIITAPIGAIIILLMLLLLIATPALGALIIGKQILEMIRPRREIRLEILIGSLTLVVLSFIPGFLGLAIFLFYILFLGAIIREFLNSKNKKTKKRQKKKQKK